MDISEYYFDDDEYDGFNEISNYDIWTHYIKSCSIGLHDSLYPLLISIIIFTFMQRLILSFDGYISRKTIDFLIGSLGISFLIYKQVNHVTIIAVLIYFVISSLFISIFRTYTYLGPTFIILSLIGTILCEIIVGSQLFLTFRGSWMIMTMKMISISFDIHDKEDENVGVLEMFGYIFNPSTYFFGLFTNYKRYRTSTGFKDMFRDGYDLLLSTGYLLISIGSLFYSDCLLDLIFDFDVEYLNEYKTAQSFRFGHYFINYFLWSTALLGGIKSKDFQVINAMKIEIPRSMEEVVTSWNIPMHEFLHKYVYINTKKISQPIAVSLTFLTSALMHGLNFQISAVLISLALFAVTESLLRKRLAYRLNLCIKSRPCKNCNHNNRKMAAYFINFVFIIINIVLLVYLGMPFDNSREAEIGYSMKHTLNYWYKWNFIGHCISFLMLFLSFII